MASTEERLRALVDANLWIEGRPQGQPLNLHINILESGVSSSDIVAFWRLVCEEFDINIPADEFAALLTPSDLIAYLDAHAG